MGLDLRHAPGRFELRWIEVATGDFRGRQGFEDGCIVEIAALEPGHWLAAITPPPAPSEK